jgi:hypothetical protein
MYGLFPPKDWLQKSLPVTNWPKLPSQVVLFAHWQFVPGVGGAGAVVEAGGAGGAVGGEVVGAGPVPTAVTSTSAQEL